MKEKFLKVLCLIMSLVMLTSALAACGQQKAPTMDTDTQETTEPTTEPKPQVQVLSGFTYRWTDGPKTMTVGKELTLDAFGRLAGVEKRYDTLGFQYDDTGKLVRLEMTDKEDGTVGYEEWTYTDGLLTARYYNENDGFRSIQDAKVTTKLDEAGRVIELTEKITYTDPEDGSKDSGTIRYEFEYDANGYVSAARYYNAKGKLDHTTNLTYDENGNLLVYSNVGSSAGEYLRFEFTYEWVDADTVQESQVAPFDYYWNWDSMIGQIL